MWWFGTVVSWKEIIYLLILIAGSIWGLIRWSAFSKEGPEFRYKTLSYVFIFWGFFAALIVNILHLSASVSAARAAMIQGLDNAPPIPIWGSLRVLEWGFLIAGALISLFFNIYNQHGVNINQPSGEGNDH